MKLVIGGYAQGKLNYVLHRYDLKPEMIWDGELPENAGYEIKAPVINNLQNFIKRRIENGGCPEEEIMQFVRKYPDCVIISDEVGNGIVPADAFEREYRERTGKILVELAEKAEEVERVICGIAQKIK